MKHCLIFSRELFYVTTVLCLNILWLKAVSEITARQTETSLRKNNVTKVRGIEYLTTEIELVLPTIKSRTIHKIIEYLTLGLLSSLWNREYNSLLFDPPRTHILHAVSFWSNFYAVSGKADSRQSVGVVQTVSEEKFPFASRSHFSNVSIPPFP